MRNILVLVLLLAVLPAQAKSKVQGSVDAPGPSIKVLQSSSSQRSIVYVDEGESDWQAVVLVGGGGTSGRV